MPETGSVREKFLDMRITLGDLIAIATAMVTVTIAYGELHATDLVFDQRISEVEGRLRERSGDHDILVRLEVNLRQIKDGLDNNNHGPSRK
jgi:hypothetical protein